jgi:hypothetical protein
MSPGLASARVVQTLAAGMPGVLHCDGFHHDRLVGRHLRLSLILPGPLVQHSRSLLNQRQLFAGPHTLRARCPHANVTETCAQRAGSVRVEAQNRQRRWQPSETLRAPRGPKTTGALETAQYRRDRNPRSKDPGRKESPLWPSTPPMLRPCSPSVRWNTSWAAEMRRPHCLRTSGASHRHPGSRGHHRQSQRLSPL